MYYIRSTRGDTYQSVTEEAYCNNQSKQQWNNNGDDFLDEEEGLLFWRWIQSIIVCCGVGTEGT